MDWNFRNDQPIYSQLTQRLTEAMSPAGALSSMSPIFSMMFSQRSSEWRPRCAVTRC